MPRDKSENNWLEKILEKLDPEPRKNAEQIWKEAPKTDDSQHVPISDSDKEDIFSNIMAETGINPEAENVHHFESNTEYASRWKWIAAAAVILIAAGLSYLTIPINHTAPYGEMVTVTLPDDSRVTLNSGTSISYNRLFDIMDRDISLQGEAYFEVENDDIPFIVHTSNTSVKVLGTAFNIRSWAQETDNETSVVLTEGSLSFYPEGQPDKYVILKPGEKSIFKQSSGTPTQPVTVDRERALAWTENRFAFESMTLVQIINEIERRFNLDIQVQQEDVLFDTLTVYYNKNVTAEQIIQDICQTKALSFRKINGGFVIED
ncbi:DUF4974 domain-containing protein [Balneolaceae bacterium YR4-1]|uniref:DUF4974 domain-containing protein n=1 Tax=Halalkalibaculum roseum TaxID=2709311 RepID=A0A6M1T1X0_9BACT|nr:FecR family protein [Halalkalibaculum roseum]NGP76757.1 DUF4974 domain-containing protein [Halalkalibaculum roseum]